jgi:MFS transporter, DHA1 family, multidrug resistance protein
VPETDRRPPPPPIALLLAYLASSYLAMAIVLPAMPAMAVALDSDAASVQLTLTAYLAAFAVGQLIIGPLSDRYGRRPILIIGFAVFTLASLACAVAPGIALLTVARAFQGLGACAGLVVTRAVIGDAFDSAATARIMGYAAMAMGVSPAIAPLIGGSLEVWFGWRSVFWFTTAYGAICLLLTWTVLRETRHVRGHAVGLIGQLWRDYRSLMRSPNFLAFTATSGLSTAGFFAFMSAAPLVFIGAFGMRPDLFGSVILLFPLGFITGSFVTTRLTGRFGLVRLTIWGSVAVFAATLVLTALPLAGFIGAAAVIVCIPFIGFFHGLVSPTGIAGAVSARPDIVGAGAAFAGFAHLAVASLVATAMGTLVYQSQLPMAAVMLAIATLGLVAAFAVVRTHARPAAGRPA